MFKGLTKEEAKVNAQIDSRALEIATRKDCDGERLGQFKTAMNMFNLFESIVSNTEWADASELRSKLKEVCKLLIAKDKLNFVVRNCSERMIKILK